jgi:DNA-binding LacI/PurR family transcriptional regulator
MRSARRDKTQKFDIHHVAALARVSIATVSRTMNHVSTVDPELAARVWKAVEKLNYVPNNQARALVSGRSRLLGLIVSEITNPFFPELIQEFEHVAVAHGYEILITSTTYDRVTMNRCVRRMVERKVEGVAIMTFGIDEGALDLFASEGMPTVFIDSASPHPLSSVVEIDYKKGICEGVQHLKELGHDSIAFLSGPTRLRSAAMRRLAFKQGMRAAGLEARKELIVEGNHTLDGGRDAMKRLLGLSRPPTAIMCSNDMSAIGVQHALFEENYRLPHDFSLIGFDDIHLAQYTVPPLTTIRMGCKDLAQAAVGKLIEHIRPGESSASISKRITTTLVVRQTTGPPRRSEVGTHPPAKGKKRRGSAAQSDPVEVPADS